MKLRLQLILMRFLNILICILFDIKCNRNRNRKAKILRLLRQIRYLTIK
jgi:hypothetical protein